MGFCDVSIGKNMSYFPFSISTVATLAAHIDLIRFGKALSIAIPPTFRMTTLMRFSTAG